MRVEKVDFVAVPSQDAERSRQFYGEVLGLRPDSHAQYEFWAGETCLGIWEPARYGMEFAPQKNGHIALRVDDVEEARRELEARGVEFRGETFDSGVCHMAFFTDPDGNDPCSIAGTRPMSRPELIERYRALPLPSTSDEHWRFTDLRGFDPEAFTADAGGISRPASMLDIDVAGVAFVGEGGVQIERAPEGLTFEPLGEDEELLHRLVGWDEKFAAHNAAMWRHGLVVKVPKGVVVERPLYVRIANSVPQGSLFWRLLIVLEAEARLSIIEEYASERPDLHGYSNAVTELFVGPAAKLEYVSVQNLSRETWHFATHHARVDRDAELDWVAGGFGSKKGKIWIQNDLAGPGATSRVTGAYFADGDQHIDYDTFQSHVAPNARSDFAFKGALRDRATAVWRGMIRVEKDAQRTDAYQESRALMLSPDAHAVPIPGLEILANDVRCTHGATVGRVDRDELFYCMARGLTRAEAERLIVRGFFQDILDRIELEPVREAVAAALEARIPQA
jgi:Fe-S cluster assembly protein SufD